MMEDWLSKAVLGMGRTCENCHKRPGFPYTFFYGHIASVRTEVRGIYGGTQRTQRITYAIDGSDVAYICQSCLKRAQRNQAIMRAILAVLAGVSAVAMFVAGNVVSIISGLLQGLPIGIGTLALIVFLIGFPAAVAIWMFVQVGRYLFSGADGRANLRDHSELGEKMAIGISSARLEKELARRGYQGFKAWTPRQYKESTTFRM